MHSRGTSAIHISHLHWIDWSWKSLEIVHKPLRAMITRRFLAALLVLCTGLCWSHGKGRIVSELGSFCQIRENAVILNLLWLRRTLLIKWSWYIVSPLLKIWKLNNVRKSHANTDHGPTNNAKLMTLTAGLRSTLLLSNVQTNHCAQPERISNTLYVIGPLYCIKQQIIRTILCRRIHFTIMSGKYPADQLVALRESCSEKINFCDRLQWDFMRYLGFIGLSTHKILCSLVCKMGLRCDRLRVIAFYEFFFYLGFYSVSCFRLINDNAGGLRLAASSFCLKILLTLDDGVLFC